jgi:putative tryptophan/tyrosine transport system substrate-binding protein
MKIIGILNSGLPNSVGEQFVAFHRGLEEVGYRDGENVVVEDYWANNNYGDLRTKADDLAGRRDVAVIVAAGGTVSARAAKEATATNRKPVVFTAVTNLDDSELRVPNLTGTWALTSELDSKRLELLHKFSSTAAMRTRIGILAHSRRHHHREQLKSLKMKVQNLSLHPVPLEVENERQIDEALEREAQPRFDALLVTADPFFNSQRAKIIAGATGLRVPAIYQWSGFVAAGGLMSYGPRITDAYRLAGVYAGRILANPNLPLPPTVLPTRFEMVINYRIAIELGGALPELLASAVVPPPEQQQAEIDVIFKRSP